MLAACRGLLAERGPFLRRRPPSLPGTMLAGRALGFLAFPRRWRRALFLALFFAINLIGTHVLVSGERRNGRPSPTFSSVGLLFGMVPRPRRVKAPRDKGNTPSMVKPRPTLNEIPRSPRLCVLQRLDRFPGARRAGCGPARGGLMARKGVGSVTFFGLRRTLGPQQPAPRSDWSPGSPLPLAFFPFHRVGSPTDWP
ncbi:MAG: hypothetical protein CM15mP18_5130 [Methanobacteriota archaeon]|nr:MAG: hypothetical protein CM15mP18_5130 [Euryarchaeota archaeon]